MKVDNSKELTTLLKATTAGRLLLFLLLLLTVWLSIRYKETAWLAASALLLAGFLFLVKRSVTLKNRISHLEKKTRIRLDERNAARGDYSAFDPGTDFIDFHHEYSYDLDLFGEHSIYRVLARIATPAGRQKLAGLLKNPGTDPNQIRLRQDAVRELTAKPDWRVEFLATGRESDWSVPEPANIRNWLEAPDRFTSRLLKIIILTHTLLSSFLLLTFFLLPFLLPSAFLPSAFLLYYLLPLALVVSRASTISREQARTDRLLGIFSKYAGMLKLIEEEPFRSELLKSLQSGLGNNGIRSSRRMKELTNILWALETRGNLIVTFLLNALVLWDFRQMIRLEKWRRDNRKSLEQWMDAIAWFESLNSLAGHADLHPEYTWPEILEGEFRFTLTDGGHPLIDPKKRVDNSMEFNNNQSLFLITGANMAGKSTLLRMVGVNMVLAMAGGPVCARRFALTPVGIHTSVRTNDSLGDDESYFYAELKRLSALISRLEQGERLFIIIDEMLKGTNSRDKHAGSAALIRRLARLNAAGLIATHDVELGTLEEELNGVLATRCFEVEIEDDQLQFDYRLRPGVSKSLNATFLMNRMGIIG